MKIRYTPKALEDLREIKEFIKELHDTQTAYLVAKDILKACSVLKKFPEMGTSLEAKTGRKTDLRIFIHNKHIVIYRISDDFVEVSRIIDSRQDYIRVLFRDEIS